MCDDDHHAKKECERVEVDRPIGFLWRDCANRHHQRRTGERDAGAIEPQARNPPERDAAVSQQKDNSSSDCERGRFHFQSPLCVRENIQVSAVKKISD